MKKLLALVLTLASLLSLTACGGSNGGNSGSSDGAVSITIFNSKNEIQPDLEAAAAAYSAANGVNIEVYYSQDTVAAHLATRYAAKDPYTINMVDAKDVYTLGAQYGYDMSGQEWVADTDYAITVDGKVVGFPVCVEARGILYNADAIKATLGEDFNPRQHPDAGPVQGVPRPHGRRRHDLPRRHPQARLVAGGALSPARL